MLRYYYINKEWIVSDTARRIYHATAIVSLVLFFLLVFLRLEIELQGKIPEFIVLILRPLLLIGVVGAAITTVAMEYFLFGFDVSPAWRKVLWFCAMIFVPLGPALYCFIVYSRSDVLKGDLAQRASA